MTFRGLGARSMAFRGLYLCVYNEIFRYIGVLVDILIYWSLGRYIDIGVLDIGVLEHGVFGPRARRNLDILRSWSMGYDI